MEYSEGTQKAYEKSNFYINLMGGCYADFGPRSFNAIVEYSGSEDPIIIVEALKELLDYVIVYNPEEGYKTDDKKLKDLSYDLSGKNQRTLSRAIHQICKAINLIKLTPHEYLFRLSSERDPNIWIYYHSKKS